MGSKQTKLEGEYLPQTPQMQHQPITIQTDFGDDLEDNLDPRSPHICRTPLNEITERKEQNYHQATAIPGSSTDQPMGLLRKRFFKGFSYNLNDPRSPSVFLNRTPLVFDETVNLDDTFSDLFVETKIPRSNVPFETQTQVSPPKLDNKETSVEELEVEEEHKTEKDDEDIREATTPKTTKSNPQEILIERDPRSPSIGVDRTPIILNDDDAPDEDDMIETILSTLSLGQKMPSNKPLDRIRNKRTSKATTNSIRRDMIYEDHADTTPAKAPRSVLDSPSATAKRTPLSCLKNNPQLRSKSVEVSGKTNKTRLPLTSFDDTLHKITPVKKILRYSNMENIENSFEF